MNLKNLVEVKKQVEATGSVLKVVQRSEDWVGPLSMTMQQVRDMQDQVDAYGALVNRVESALYPVLRNAQLGLDKLDSKKADEPFASSSIIAIEIEATVRAQRSLNEKLEELLSRLEI